MNSRRAIIIGWATVVLLALGLLSQGPAIQSDLGQFLPQSDETGSSLLLDTLRDGPGSRLLLLDLSGAEPPQLAASTKQLAAALSATPYFQHILGAGTSLPEEEQALLFRYRYLLNATSLDASILRQAIQQRLQELAIGAPTPRSELRADPIAQHRKTLLRLSDNNGPQRSQGVWFSSDQQHAMLLLHTAAPAFALDQQEQTLTAIDHAFSTLAQPQLTLTLSGPPRFGVESRQLIRSESQQLTLVASFGVALILLLAFRSFAAALLVALPLLSGIIAGAAAVLLLFGSLHGITLAFGITLIGLAVDYPIHLFSHGGRKATATQLWPTMRLGVVTSVVGFSALLLSDFTGLAQMGLFAIIGLIVAASVTRWVLPALHPAGYRLHIQLPPFLNRQGRGLSVWLAPLLLLLSLTLLVLSGDSIWESRLDRLSPIPPAQLEQDKLLRQRLNAPEPGQLLLLEDASQEQLLQRCEALTQQLLAARESGVLESFNSPTHYLPSARQQTLNRDALPTSESLATMLTKASSGLPFRKGVFQPFIDEVVLSKGLPPLTPADLDGTLTGLRLASLLREKNGRHYALVTLGGIHQPEALKSIARSAAARYLDLPREAAQLVDRYREETLRLMGFGILAILLLLAVTLRNLRRVVLVALPVLTAIAADSALLYLFGQPLSLFHLSSLLLVLGIGLDYGLFADRCRSSNEGCRETASALLLCSATTLLVFGLLALSAVPVLHAIGLTVSIGILLTLLLTLGGGNRSPDSVK